MTSEHAGVVVRDVEVRDTRSRGLARPARRQIVAQPTGVVAVCDISEPAADTGEGER